MRIPRKQSLVNETYHVLRESIETGLWKRTLPGERTLCAHYLVSRPTLRQALNRLEDEGLIANMHGKHRSITGRTVVPINPEKRLRIGLLCPTPPQEMIGCTNRKVAFIDNYVHRQQMTFQMIVRPKCFNESPHKALSSLLEENRIDCWILQHTNHKMQSWFDENRVAAVITGTRYPGVKVPFVDLDNRAICRHAVGLLLARGRERICFLRNNANLPGDLLSENGFREGIQQNHNASGYVLRHNNTTGNICGVIDHLLSGKKGIDSFVVNESSAAFTVVSHLMRIGAKIPGDFAVISRTEAMYFNFMSPSIAYYTRPNDEMARRTVDFAIKLSNGTHINNPEHLIIPEFVPGESLG